jgi:hypothetical protein
MIYPLPFHHGGHHNSIRTLEEKLITNYILHLPPVVVPLHKTQSCDWYSIRLGVKNGLAP